MNKKYLLTVFFLITTLVLVTTNNVNSKISSPPAGNSGDPNTNQTCARSGCHPTPAHTPSASDLTLTIGTGSPTTDLNNSFQYTPSTAYNIAFLINAFTGRYGFQFISLNAANAMAGSFTVSNAATEKINTSGTRNYMGHLNASSTKSWTFKWTSPAAGTGPVTFYYAYNTADNNGQSTGDVIYNNSVTVQEGPLGIEDISNKISDLNIFPNPISNEFSISFDMKETETVSAQLYSLGGREVNQVLNEKVSEGNFVHSFNTNDLSAGIYLMKLNVGGASVTKKIVKQ